MGKITPWILREYTGLDSRLGSDLPSPYALTADTGSGSSSIWHTSQPVISWTEQCNNRESDEPEVGGNNLVQNTTLTNDRRRFVFSLFGNFNLSLYFSCFIKQLALAMWCLFPEVFDS